MLTNKQLEKTLGEIEWLKKYYNKHFAVEAKPFTGEYDKKLRGEMRGVVERINNDVDKAAEPITLIDGKPGRPPKDRVLLTKLHLFQVLFEFTNREMECFSLMFLLNGEEAFSYKTIERAYSDPIVAIILHNLFVLSAGEPRKVDSSADGTGIGLFISKHYRKDREHDLKENKDTSKRKEYLMTVAILDIDTNLYVGYAAGFKGEVYGALMRHMRDKFLGTSLGLANRQSLMYARKMLPQVREKVRSVPGLVAGMVEYASK